MEIIRSDEQLERYIKEAAVVSGDSPVLLDSYLVGAIEVDVDALSDGKTVHVAGIMQHIEEAGVHSGDSACSLPPFSLPQSQIDDMISQTKALALGLNVVGLMNIQFAIKGDEIFILEVNPRASRTVPFVAKAINSPIAAIAARVMAGEPLSNFDLKSPTPNHFAVKEAVMPFNRFPGVDALLGPEMRSTGEVMGLDKTFERAFWKSQLGASTPLPTSGTVFISVKEDDKDNAILEAANILLEQGFSILATGGTSVWLNNNGVHNTRVKKVYEGQPNIVDALKNSEIDLIFNTTQGSQSLKDSRAIRAAALSNKICYYTTAAASNAAAKAIKDTQNSQVEVNALQNY